MMDRLELAIARFFSGLWFFICLVALVAALVTIVVQLINNHLGGAILALLGAFVIGLVLAHAGAVSDRLEIKQMRLRAEREQRRRE